MIRMRQLFLGSFVSMFGHTRPLVLAARTGLTTAVAPLGCRRLREGMVEEGQFECTFSCFIALVQAAYPWLEEDTVMWRPMLHVSWRSDLRGRRSAIRMRSTGKLRRSLPSLCVVGERRASPLRFGLSTKRSLEQAIASSSPKDL